jgi:hypothetical protein
MGSKGSYYGSNIQSVALDGKVPEELVAAKRKVTDQYKGVVPIDDYAHGDSSHGALSVEDIFARQAEHEASESDDD